MVTSALSCLPATLLQVLQPNSSLRAAVTMRLAASSCNFPQSTRVALWLRTTFCATVTMRLATSSCNPACQCQERRRISHAWLHAAVPMRCVTAGCKPAYQERHSKSTNLRAALTMRTIPRYSEKGIFFYAFWVKPSSRYTVWCTFCCRPHLPKVFRSLHFLKHVKCKSSSPYSLVRFLSTTFLDAETLLR